MAATETQTFLLLRGLRLTEEFEFSELGDLAGGGLEIKPEPAVSGRRRTQDEIAAEEAVIPALFGA